MIIMLTSGADQPAANVLRRTDFRPGLVHGAERDHGAQVVGEQREDHSVYHTPAIFRGVRHV